VASDRADHQVRGGPAVGWPQAASIIINGLTSPLWRALGRATAGAATSQEGDIDPYQYLAEVEDLITQLPEANRARGHGAASSR
jgi:hypothetical protein